MTDRRGAGGRHVLALNRPERKCRADDKAPDEQAQGKEQQRQPVAIQQNDEDGSPKGRLQKDGTERVTPSRNEGDTAARGTPSGKGAGRARLSEQRKGRLGAMRA